MKGRLRILCLAIIGAAVLATPLYAAEFWTLLTAENTVGARTPVDAGGATYVGVHVWRADAAAASTSIVWPGSPECADQRGGDALHVPTEQRLRSIRYATAQILWYDLRSGALATEATQAEQQAAWVLAQEAVPVYHDGPIWVTAATPPGYEPTCGDYWCGCASGVGTWPPKIDVSQPLGRVERLVAWEITNAFLGSIRRPDLWDGPYVSSVVAGVGQQIGGWSD